jgi:hypothetical protein
MPASEKIRQLVKRFEENLDSYRSGRYNEETHLQREIEPSADKTIDALVYELYGLTEEEIGIVEGRSEL